jgi:hypothetical protein
MSTAQAEGAVNNALFSSNWSAKPGVNPRVFKARFVGPLASATSRFLTSLRGVLKPSANESDDGESAGPCEGELFASLGGNTISMLILGE